MLVEAGAAVDIKNNEQETALDMAEDSLRDEVVSYLEQVMTVKKELQELEQVAPMVKGAGLPVPLKGRL